LAKKKIPITTKRLIFDVVFSTSESNLLVNLTSYNLALYDFKLCHISFFISNVVLCTYGELVYIAHLIKCPLVLVWNQVELGRTGVNTNPGVILLSVSHL
jgi:hypothetical protein